MARMQRNRLRITSRSKPWRSSERASKLREKYSKPKYMKQENRAAWFHKGRTTVRGLRVQLHQWGEMKQAATLSMWVLLRRRPKLRNNMKKASYRGPLADHLWSSWRKRCLLGIAPNSAREARALSLASDLKYLRRRLYPRLSHQISELLVKSLSWNS